MPANQRAVLILREVRGFSAAEITAVLATTPDACGDRARQARHYRRIQGRGTTRARA